MTAFHTASRAIHGTVLAGVAFARSTHSRAPPVGYGAG